MSTPSAESEIRVPSNPEADAAFLADFTTMSAFGATAAGGVERQAATDEDIANRRWLAEWLIDRGFTVAYDRVGNMFGLYEFAPGRPYVLAGSHMDSQPRGGKYDGAYGVLAAAHSLDRLRRYYDTHPEAVVNNIAVVNWFNEEGSRFKPSMQGSGVFTGKIPLTVALETEDSAGVTVFEALSAANMLGEHDVFDSGEHVNDDDLLPIASYAEIHIEQGRELDKAGMIMGIVDSTWGANKYELSVLGHQAHTGATAIADRQDALYGAAQVVVGLRELADSYGDDLHTSCGQLTVIPNSPVVVAREVEMHMDLRSPDDAILEEADAKLNRLFAEIEVRADVKIEKRFAHTWKGHTYTPEGVSLSTKVIEDLGVSHMHVRTRAGHDSTNMKDIVPTVMLFIPSVDGVSHAENEFTHDDDMIVGVDVLTETLARMVEGAL